MRLDRRPWIKAMLASAVGLAIAQAGFAEEPAAAPGETNVADRNIELYNTHTRESVAVIFKRGDQYDNTALAALSNVLRDHRNGQSHDMDPGLFDQLFDLAAAAKVRPHYEIISGYRSPESNDKMSSAPGSGVSKNSLHMQGRAMDVRLKGCTCETLRDLALAAKRGGVGYYPKSDFVHIDTGRFRTWVG